MPRHSLFDPDLLGFEILESFPFILSSSNAEIKVVNMTDHTEKTIDETPISPIERRNSLEKHLQMRPDAKDLKDRHILLDTNAAPYEGPQFSAKGR